MPAHNVPPNITQPIPNPPPDTDAIRNAPDTSSPIQLTMAVTAPNTITMYDVHSSSAAMIFDFYSGTLFPKFGTKSGLDKNHLMSVRLETSDNQVRDVPRAIAEMSVTIRNMLEDADDEGDAVVPLMNVSSKILEKVIAYCEHYHEHPDTADNGKDGDISSWDSKFCEVDQATLFELILAANFLDIKSLLEVTCKKVASMIRGKSPDEIRKTFCIKNDFTKDEEDQVRKENEWCMDL